MAKFKHFNGHKVKHEFLDAGNPFCDSIVCCKTTMETDFLTLFQNRYQITLETCFLSRLRIN